MKISPREEFGPKNAIAGVDKIYLSIFEKSVRLSNQQISKQI